MKFKILYESYDDKGTYGFLTKSSFSEFKKVTKKLVALLDKYDKVIDELEAKADSEGTQELLEKDAYYNSLIKAYSNSYETILSLDNAFKNNYIKVDTFHPSDEVVVDLSIYKVDDLYDLLYDLQDTLSKSNNLDEGLNTNMKFLVENELEKRHKKHKKTIKSGTMGSFIHPDGGNQIAIDTFNNSVDMGNFSSSSSCCGLAEDLDTNDIEKKLDNYISSNNISVEKLFGRLNYNDPRYMHVFSCLKDLGYKPTQTASYPRGYFVPAMTITLENKEVPDDLINILDSIPGVVARHVGFHRGANNFKLKFELEDVAYRDFSNDLFDNESLTESSDSESSHQAEKKLKRLISVQHFISPKDDIQLFTTEKGNYLVKRNGKQMMILDKKNFRESEIEDLRLNGYFRDYDEARMNEALTEDTIKQNSKWVNKGKEGTHGKFNTKKQADAQRRAMFANGYNEDWNVIDQIDAEETIGKLKPGDKFKNRNGTVITIIDPTKDGTIQFKIQSKNYPYDVRCGKEKSIQNMLYKNNYMRIEDWK